jgi:hypothetical protein
MARMKIKYDIKKLAPLRQKQLLDRYRACVSVLACTFTLIRREN